MGKPFQGSAKAVLALNLMHAQSAPTWLLRRVPALFATLPGGHDLLDRAT
ncbi:hypothetical protein ABTX35_20155 [Streptomyces sp. NPDC096080]